MKSIHIVLFAALLAQPAFAAERSATFSVSNMTCPLCPITVRSAISRVQGVISVEVNGDLAHATVVYDDAQATTDAIAAASANAGYPATVIQVQ
ncbi:MAG: cation transporter [Aestuariivirga sp.]